jgi:2',3'-cyclic-nucleotide 2'-phosphodiesterase (5'-nucleotidase family)
VNFRFLILFCFFSSLFAQKLTILHVNDMHCQFAATPATWVQKEPKPMIGGMTALQHLVTACREQAPATLLLNAGDIMTGTPIAKIEQAGVLGGGYVEMLNLLGFQAMTIGNHEFDEGQENLQKLIHLSRCDVLCANLYQNDELLTRKPYAIYNIGSIRVGVIGLTLSKLFEETARKHLQGIRVEDPTLAAQKYIDQIDAQTDLIVLLTHQGVEEDLAMADKIHGADVIVGGHSHTRLNKPIRRNRIVVVQADSKTRYLGRLDLTVVADSVAHYDYELLPAWVDSVKNPDPAMHSLVQKYQNQIDAEYGQPLGELLVEWQRSHQAESNIGNYLTDVVRTTMRTDFAVLNSGGIRKDVHRGKVTKLDIVEILPFTNYITTFRCTGAELIKIMETNAQAALRQEPGILQVSGLTYAFKITKGGAVEMRSVKINGRAVDPQKIYSGATVDFITGGQAEKYFGFATPNSESTGLLLSDAVIDYIKKHPQIRSKIEGRIRSQDERRKH